MVHVVWVKLRLPINREKSPGILDGLTPDGVVEPEALGVAITNASTRSPPRGLPWALVGLGIITSIARPLGCHFRASRRQPHDL